VSGRYALSRHSVHTPGPAGPGLTFSVGVIVSSEAALSYWDFRKSTTMWLKAFTPFSM